MDTLILGIDLSDNGTTLVYYGNEQSWYFPTVICREKSADTWFVGEQGYASALKGEGVITDKLLTLTQKHGMATIGGVRYEGYEVLRQFLKTVTEITMAGMKSGYPEQIVITIPTIEGDIVEQLIKCMMELGYSKHMIHVISRAESFIYYVMSQPHDIWNNQVGLFELSNNSLTYYELRVMRNLKEITVFAESQKLEDGFNLEIIQTPAGAKLGDKILVSCADRLLKKKLFSSIFLSGKGFSSIDWAENFTKTICSKRKVFADVDLFARGACNKGYDYASSKKIFNFRCICDGRLDTSILLKVEKRGRDMEYPIALAGDKWYENRQNIRLIYDGSSDLMLIIEALDKKRRRVVKVPLSFLPKRPPRTTAISLVTEFTNNKNMKLTISDMGFGELYPASDASLCQEVKLWD